MLVRMLQNVGGLCTPSARGDAIRRLEALGYKKGEQTVNEALERLGRGETPFLPKKPVEGDRIITVLKTWRRRKKAAVS